MSLSVIVPTYNETDNIRPLTERLFRATRAAKLETELLVMDDESEGTAETERIVDRTGCERKSHGSAVGAKEHGSILWSWRYRLSRKRKLRTVTVRFTFKTACEKL